MTIFQQNKVPGFEDAGPTIAYIRRISNLITAMTANSKENAVEHHVSHTSCLDEEPESSRSFC